MNLIVQHAGSAQTQVYSWYIHDLDEEGQCLFLRETLLSHFQSDGHFIWPNDRARGGSVPDMVVLTTDDGRCLMRYGLDELLRDTGVVLRDTSPDDQDGRRLRR